MRVSSFVLFLALLSQSIMATPNHQSVKKVARTELLEIHSHRLKDFSAKKSIFYNVNQKEGEARPAIKGLSLVEAQRRKEMISNVSYDLKLDLSRNMKKNKFHGVAKIEFDFEMPKSANQPLTIDFLEGHVKWVTINGWPVWVNRKKEENVFYNGYFLSIPLKKLKSGHNKIKIRYSHQYDVEDKSIPDDEQPAQEGLHRIIEKGADGKVRNYLYTQFEVFAANKMFPCFDQPNLKADYALKVKAPKSWEVITATSASSVIDNGSNKNWTFPKTNSRFSTYVYSLHAGPYKKWEGPTFKNRIPMNLYVRQSQAEQFAPQVEKWFKATEEGFEFFEDYFGIEYPFDKYDQIIVPEFWAGAMENVGAVTFREERFVIDDEIRADAAKFEERWRYIIMVILHEMTHMWFGNLVTPKWWGDLWLNESFATYFPLLAMKKSSLITNEQDKYFHMWEKIGAYRTDDGTKSSISASATDTNEADSLFDGIRYNKGASVLKQLSYYIGADTFQIGIQNYLDKNSFLNTNAGEFFFQMDTASVFDLSQWFNNWIQKKGYNIISADYKCNSGIVSDFSIVQELGTSEVLRTHKTNLAFYNNTANGWVKSSELKGITYRDERTVFSKLLGAKCPDFVLLNYNDQDYVRVRLSSSSQKNLTSILNSNDLDPLNLTVIGSNSVVKELPAVEVE